MQIKEVYSFRQDQWQRLAGHASVGEGANVDIFCVRFAFSMCAGMFAKLRECNERKSASKTKNPRSLDEIHG